ncbi:lantibiotic dehydratase [Actinomadura sp. 9N215]|uniref:lantibiotic dehydratase n=1 Tax=Actinomadura sp. 9N215 TaxID=3375150 RepID=UPI0037B9B572
MYRHLDHALIRGAARPRNTDDGSWPDLSDHPGAPSTWRPWLNQIMKQADFSAALELASPSLFHRTQQLRGGQTVGESAARRAVLSVLRYALRAGSRATPFGLFAGVAPARLDASAPPVGDGSRFGHRHRAVVRVDAAWLAGLVEQLETEPTLWPCLLVRANNMIFIRDGHLVQEYRPQRSGCSGPEHVRIGATAPVQAVLALAQVPITLSDLAEQLAVRFPNTDSSAVTSLLISLLAQRVLVTDLHPPIGCPDPLGHLIRHLRPAIKHAPSAAGFTGRLRQLDEHLRDHNRSRAAADSHAAARECRTRLKDVMDKLDPASAPALAVDLQLDWDVRVPECVAEEASRAASLLVRLAGRPALTLGWVRWHAAFLDRFGPRAVVPVRDVVNADMGLGYPASYLGGPPLPAGDTLNERDRLLLALAQRAALGGQCEIVLEETTISALSTETGHQRAQPTTEVTARVLATDEGAVRAGRFTLAVVGVSRSAGTTIGRFLNLPGADDLSLMLADLPSSTQDALVAQLCAAPLHATTGNVAALPEVLPHQIVLGQYYEDSPKVIPLDDLAVTADLHRLYLVSRSRQTVVEPVSFNAVELSRRTHPLVRFLAEVPHAMSVPCATFDWGAAANLPFLPALRHGRTILSPARWLLSRTELPGPTASTRAWDEAFAAWRERNRLPQQCYLGEGDQRLGLDLTEPSHRAVLRAHLRRTGRTSLRALLIDERVAHRPTHRLSRQPHRPGDPPEERDTGGLADWCGGYPHEIVIPLVTTQQAPPAPSWLENVRRPVDVRTHGRHPLSGGQLYLKLYGHPDRQNTILVRHLPDLLSSLDPPDQNRSGSSGRYWFVRYRDPDPHLRLRLQIPRDQTAAAVAAVTAWTTRLQRRGLATRVQFDTDFPETDRFGGPVALPAAEEFFAADSDAAVTQLTAAAAADGPQQRAVTAASMLDLTVGFCGDVDQALRWLIEHTRPASTAPPRALYDQAITLANPHDHTALARLAFNEQLLACWAQRRLVLAAYRRALDANAPASVSPLLPELLHLHHVRMAGVDPKGERTCLHLARAAALSWSSRRAPREPATAPRRPVGRSPAREP